MVPRRVHPIVPHWRRAGKRRWTAWAQVVLTLGLLAVVAHFADWGRITFLLTSADAALLGAGFAAKAMGLPLAGQRWHAACMAAGVSMSRWLAFRLVLAGLFLGQALPGTVGGDLARGWLTWRGGHSPTAVILALFVDRLAATLGIMLIIVLGLPYLALIVAPSVVWGAVIGVGLVALAPVALLLAGRMASRLHPGPSLVGRVVESYAGIWVMTA